MSGGGGGWKGWLKKHGQRPEGYPALTQGRREGRRMWEGGEESPMQTEPLR